jgi:hypothetical protein
VLGVSILPLSTISLLDFGTVPTLWCCSSCCIALDVNLSTILSLIYRTVSLVLLLVFTESPGNQEICGLKSATGIKQ